MQQIAALRNYLVRMASQLNSAASAPAVTTSYVTADGRRIYKNGASTAPQSAGESADIEAVRKNAQELRQLIIKTADGLGGDIVAKSEEARKKAEELQALIESTSAELSSAIETGDADALSEARQKAQELQELIASTASDLSGDITAGNEAASQKAEELQALIASTAAELSSAIAAGDEEALNEAQQKAQELQALISSTADGLSSDIAAGDEAARGYTDAQIYALSETYLGRSEFGSFTENIESQIVNSARGVVEGYNFSQRIDAAQADLSLIQSYITEIDGEIRRGLVEDPETGENVTGIAISQNLQFTGEISRGEDGRSYYRLASGQTFGLYTSTGWQFWINGFKRGWYDSIDGMLHVANIVVENALSLGDSWRIVNENGLGIKYTGVK